MKGEEKLPKQEWVTYIFYERLGWNGPAQFY